MWRGLGPAELGGPLPWQGPCGSPSGYQGLADSACLPCDLSPPGLAASGQGPLTKMQVVGQWLGAWLWSQTYLASKLCDLTSLSLCLLTCKMGGVIIKIKHNKIT